jgi:CheY-like chemotaxis protein
MSIPTDYSELGRDPRVLVVDGDPATLHGLSELVRTWGFETVEASDDEAALEALSRDSAIGLVLTELVGPRLHGLDLLQKARQLRPHVEVILLTNQGTVETAVEAVRLGAFDYLSKPVDPQRLRLLLQNWVEKMELMDLRPPNGSLASDAPSPLIFLCYRREDTQGEAGRLHDRLSDVYGGDRIFMDIDSVPLGVDFVDHVTKEISRCSAVIVMIGRQWEKAKDKRRRRRLDDPDDLVRAEIAAALKQKIPVVPVLVQNATMPNATELPEDIRLLARRNGIALRHEHWREGVERLLKELNPVMRHME